MGQMQGKRAVRNLEVVDETIPKHMGNDQYLINKKSELLEASLGDSHEVVSPGVPKVPSTNDLEEGVMEEKEQSGLEEMMKSIMKEMDHFRLGKW
jgi:hypothetical protein